MNVDQYTLQEGVYYLEPSQNHGMNPIAIRPKIQQHYISWEDTGNGRSVSYSALYFDGDEIKAPFKSPKTLPQTIDVYTKGDKNSSAKHFHLVQLTNKIFEEKLRGLVACEESLKFESDEAVRKHYLKTNFGQ